MQINIEVKIIPVRQMQAEDDWVSMGAGGGLVANIH